MQQSPKPANSLLGAKAITWDYDFLSQFDNETYLCTTLTERQAAALLQCIFVMQWSTRWFNRPDDFFEIVSFASDIGLQLQSLSACESGGGGGGCDCPKLPEGVEILDDEIYITECNDMVVINVNDCCCGGSGGSGSSGGIATNGSGGTTTVNPPGAGIITPCDAAAYIVPYIFDQAYEFVTAIKQSLDLGTNYYDAVSQAAQAVPIIGDLSAAQATLIQDFVDETYDTLEAALEDSDLIYDAQVAWVKVFGNNTQIYELSREDLRSWAWRLPLFSNVTLQGAFSPKTFFFGFSQMVNITKINERLPLAEGQATEAECSTWYEESGAISPNSGGGGGSGSGDVDGFAYTTLASDLEQIRWDGLLSRSTIGTILTSPGLNYAVGWAAKIYTDEVVEPGGGVARVVGNVNGGLTQLNLRDLDTMLAPTYLGSCVGTYQTAIENARPELTGVWADTAQTPKAGKLFVDLQGGNQVLNIVEFSIFFDPTK